MELVEEEEREEEVEELEEEGVQEGVQEAQAYLSSRSERTKSRKMSPNIPVCGRRPFL